MEKDCARTRNSLKKYLRGHLFKHEQVRIARHLNACPVCRSEFQALKKVADTKQLLKDITPPDSLSGRVKEGMSGLTRIKVLFYRPLWLLAIISLGAALSVTIASRRRDVEIENIEKTLPPASYVASAPTSTPDPSVAAVPPSSPGAQTVPVKRGETATAKVTPLIITITVADGSAAVQRISEVIQGHAELEKIKFSATAKDLSGALAEKELLAFLSRIESVGKASYSRKKLKSFAAEPVPFLIRLQSAPRAPERPSPPSSGESNAVNAAGALPTSAPTSSAP